MPVWHPGLFLYGYRFRPLHSRRWRSPASRSGSTRRLEPVSRSRWRGSRDGCAAELRAELLPCQGESGRGGVAEPIEPSADPERRVITFFLISCCFFCIVCRNETSRPELVGVCVPPGSHSLISFASRRCVLSEPKRITPTLISPVNEEGARKGPRAVE